MLTNIVAKQKSQKLRSLQAYLHSHEMLSYSCSGKHWYLLHMPLGDVALGAEDHQTVLVCYLPLCSQRPS